MRLYIASALLTSTLAQDSGGGGLLGANPCTYAPNTTCYPNPLGPGWPLCCTIDPSGDLCDPDGEACFEPFDIPADFNMTDFNMTDFDISLLPFELGGLGPVIMPGDDVLGSDICTYAPNTTCFPNTDGFPPCCEDSTCTSEYPPCEELVLGGNICTYAPDKDCWPSTNGWPPCCSDDPSSCPSPSEFEAGVNPPCEEPANLPVLGSSYCTDTPDTECYHMGQPGCCFINKMECPEEKPGCDTQADVDGGSICTYSPDKDCWPSTNGFPPCCADPSSCPSPSEFEVGVNPPCEDPANLPLLGSNPCTYAPDKECYPSNNGWPMCCKETEDGSSCTDDEPCENTDGGEEPVQIEDAPGEPSSSTILGISLFIALIGGQAISFVTSMW